MKKIVLIDGNNLLFRSYYATAYNGNFMKNSKNFPTNALFGFANMINKIINEENPTHIMVAFDKGKTFRHTKYDFYKQGRLEVPNELTVQFPIAKEMLTHMGIKYLELDNYEADDIIGTFSTYFTKNNEKATIISSDKDLLQLINDKISMKMLKQSGFIFYDFNAFVNDYKINPINIIDLKALMGDSSDNIPGVKGIGEKTALKLLEDYQTLDNIYANIDNIKGALKEKLIANKENAYISYELATIEVNVPYAINEEEILYKGMTSELNTLYEDLEFYSLLKKINIQKKEEKVAFKIVNDTKDLKINKLSAVYIEMLGTNYHASEVLGIAIYNDEQSLYIPFEVFRKNSEFINDFEKITYDLKKHYALLKKENIESDFLFDIEIAAYLLDYNVKDDIAFLANILNTNIPFYENAFKNYHKTPLNNEELAEITIKKAKFIYDNYETFKTKIKEEDIEKLYYDIEHPLAYVLADMEQTGVYVSKEILESIGTELETKLKSIETKVYEIAGHEFNIASPKQVATVLYEELNLNTHKKNKTGFSTDIQNLQKLDHPIAKEIINYRFIAKLQSVYVTGLINAISSDNKVHTIYTQTLTRTGRLSSIEPNLQNIPAKSAEGRLIKKAFLPINSVLVSADYSQVELCILSSASNATSLIEAFKNDLDIHTKTASDIFHVSLEDVTKEMRTSAKAVNFGIVYGISSFGLAENLHINPKEAKTFIDNYFVSYPEVKKYMDDIIAKATEQGYVKTLFGRTRLIPEIQNKNYLIRSQGERMALNTPIQGTSADIIKIAMVDVAKRFKEKNLISKLILQVHDELIVDALDSELETVKYILKTSMENAVSLKVPLKVDINEGESWFEAK
jgi:DNA polymerase-1